MKEKVLLMLLEGLLKKLLEFPWVLRLRAAKPHLDAGHRAFARGYLDLALGHYVEAEKFARKNSLQRAEAQLCQAEVLLLLGRGAEAEQKCFEAKLLYESPRNELGLGWVERVHAEMQMRRSQWEDADASLERARRLVGADPRARAGVLRCSGRVFVEMGEMGKARAAFKQAKRLCKELGDYCGLADIARETANMLQREGKRDDALIKLNEAWAQAELADNDLSRAEVLRTQGEALLRLGRFDDAAAKCARAEQLYADCGHLVARCKTVRLDARIHAAKSAWAEAIRLYRDANLLYLELEDSVGRAWNLMLLGDALLSSGNWTEAAGAYAESWRLFTEVDNKNGAASAQISAGYLDLKRGKFDDAHRKLNKGADGLREDDLQGRANSMLYRGELDCEVGDWESASTRLETALSLFVQLKNKPKQLLTMLQQTRLLIAQGRWLEAEVKLDDAKVVLTTLDDEYLRGETFFVEGLLRQKQDRPESAASLFKDAESIFEKMQEPLARADVLCSVAETFQSSAPLQAWAKLDAALRVYIGLGVVHKAERIQARMKELSLPGVTA